MARRVLVLLALLGLSAAFAAPKPAEACLRCTLVIEIHIDEVFVYEECQDRRPNFEDCETFYSQCFDGGAFCLIA